MKFVVCEGAPAMLGKAGDVVELTRSQSTYARLRGHVVAWSEPRLAPPAAPGKAPKRRRKAK